MARLPRSLSVQSDSRVHKIWRGHNREWNLGTDEQKSRYLDFLNDDLESKKHHAGSEVQAICLMSNHTHELYNVLKATEFSNHMRRHHSRYGMYFNRQNGRSGKVAEDRPKTCLIADEEHEMKTVFYIHANPIRAHIVKDARDYRWSTHKLYAFGKKEEWMKNIRLPDWYMKLGKNMQQRQRKYRQLFVQFLKTFGVTRQNFLHSLFYGPPLWMQERRKLVSKWSRERSPPR